MLPDAAGLLELVIEGMAEGTLTIDEIMLENEADGFVALAGGSFFISSAENQEDAQDESGNPASSAPGSVYLQGTGSGVFESEPAMAASIEAGWDSSIAIMKARANPAWGFGAGSIGLGYTLAIPSRTAPLRVIDEYSRNSILGRYARSLEAALSAGGFSTLARAVSAEDAGTSSQNWKAAASLGSIVSAGASAGMLVPVSIVSDLGFIDAWAASWELLLPYAESFASSRRFEFTAGVFGSAFAATTNREYARSSAETNISARASIPITSGVFGFTPFYERSTFSEHYSGSSAFQSDIEEFAADLYRAAPLWSAIPITELWSPGAFAVFDAFSMDATSAEHRSGPGIVIRRPVGYGLVDLVVPSTFEGSVFKVVSKKDDTLLRSTLLDFSFSGGAANLFASGGVRPIFESIVFDEYSYRTKLAFKYYPEDGVVLPSITANNALSYEGMNGSMLAATSNFSFSLERSANTWSESVGFALTTKPARTWFGDLVGLVTKPLTKKQPVDGTDATWVSDWFDDILSEAPVLVETFMVDALAGKSKDPDAALNFTLALNYFTKAIAAGSLTAGFNTKVEQSLTIRDDEMRWGLRYELGIMAKVVF